VLWILQRWVSPSFIRNVYNCVFDTEQRRPKGAKEKKHEQAQTNNKQVQEPVNQVGTTHGRDKRKHADKQNVNEAWTTQMRARTAQTCMNESHTQAEGNTSRSKKNSRKSANKADSGDQHTQYIGMCSTFYFAPAHILTQPYFVFHTLSSML